MLSDWLAHCACPACYADWLVFLRDMDGIVGPILGERRRRWANFRQVSLTLDTCLVFARTVPVLRIEQTSYSTAADSSGGGGVTTSSVGVCVTFLNFDA